jgi:acyl dehydratase
LCGGAVDMRQAGRMTAFERDLADRYFEDYVPGIDVRYGAEQVSEAEVLRFADAFDPQTIHTDVARAADGPFGGLIASGWHTAALMMRIFATWFLNERASLASPGVDELRWLRPVRPGDVLSARFEVLESRVSRSKPDRGIVRTRITVLDQRDSPVMTLVAMNMIRRRGAPV